MIYEEKFIYIDLKMLFGGYVSSLNWEVFKKGSLLKESSIKGIKLKEFYLLFIFIVAGTESKINFNSEIKSFFKYFLLLKKKIKILINFPK